MTTANTTRRNRLQAGLWRDALAWVAVFFCAVGIYASDAEPVCLSPETLIASHDGKWLYIAEATARRVTAVDVAKGSVVESYAVPGTPTGLALDDADNLLCVTLGEVGGKVVLLNLRTGKAAGVVAAGHTPTAPVLSLNGRTLYVCNRFDNEVMVVDLPVAKATARIPVTREPVAAALSPDGKFLFVANHLPTGPANVQRISSVIDVVDTESRKVTSSIRLPNGAIALQCMCLSADGKILYVPSTLAHFMLSATQVERGWMNSSALHLIDVEKRKLRHSILLDDENLGAANPWGVVCSPDGKYICVAHAGTHEVSLIDQPALLAKLAKAPRRDELSLSDDAYEALTDNPADDLNFLIGIRQRIKLKGNGPRGVAIACEKLYVAEYFSGSLGIVDLASTEHAVQSVPLGSQPPMTLQRKGEMLFHDAATMCFQQWQSCSTCHPDGRADAVNWDLLNDGIGNPKNTKSLLFSVQTPPCTARGIRENADAAIRAGMKFIQFMDATDEKANALHAYIDSLTPLPSSHLVNGQLSPAGERGRAVFEKAQCAACHFGPFFTDMKMHDVGTGDGLDPDGRYDTPTLREVWRTAPYLHDGRAATLEEVLTKFNPKDRHGKTSDLNPGERRDLAEYVKSL